jgi:hypothetical protein
MRIHTLSLRNTFDIGMDMQVQKSESHHNRAVPFHDPKLLYDSTKFILQPAFQFPLLPLCQRSISKSTPWL